MSTMLSRLALVAFLGSAPILSAHDLSNPGEANPHYDWSLRPPDAIKIPSWFVETGAEAANGGKAVPQTHKPIQAIPFEFFSSHVRVSWDNRFLYVESDSMPDHGMMVGITNWQQQIPVPQNYTGSNAWRIPLVPTPSVEPMSIKGHFLRGAIAIAVNGIPIFNPQNNRGEISAEIGELDQWGGHGGRSDDYHYHIAPLSLQKVVGKGKPIAYALDGYPIYGTEEPDGSKPTGLDSFNGHTTSLLGYHYHASTNYPYVNGGFHGEVVEKGGQVDPQPRAESFRPAGTPLRGTTITAFEHTGTNSYKLTYEWNGEQHELLYSVSTNDTLSFQSQSVSGGTNTKTFLRQMHGPGDGNRFSPPTDHAREPREPQPQENRDSVMPRASATQKSSPDGTHLSLESSAVRNGGPLPVEFTGDGQSLSPPLSWHGAPSGTKAYALIMHHLDPEGKTKIYWTLYNIPAELNHLDKNAKGVGIAGCNTINRSLGYAPPHSKGPGAKNYVVTLYALAEPLAVIQPPEAVTGASLREALHGHILAQTDLSFVSTRLGTTDKDHHSEEPPPRDHQRKPPQQEE